MFIGDVLFVFVMIGVSGLLCICLVLFFMVFVEWLMVVERFGGSWRFGFGCMEFGVLLGGFIVVVVFRVVCIMGKRKGCE